MAGPSETTPGINPNAFFIGYTPDEKKIVDIFAQEWYITHVGEPITLGKSNYRFFLMKPTANYQRMFNLEREILAVISRYENFEPRVLDAFTMIGRRFQNLRIEPICSVLICNDPIIELAVRELLKNEKESQIIVPFNYNELLTIKDSYFIRNRFRKHFYSRDLFAYEAPLKTDLYFFGRNDLIYNIVNRHRTGEVSGLFGLRKTGKTSVIFGVQRALTHLECRSAFIDCQNPAFHKRNWNNALHFVIQEICNQHGLAIQPESEDEYTDINAPIIFERDLLRVHKLCNKKSLLLIFDEIENITPGVSPSEQWCDGLDFVYFWQTLRSLFQKLPAVFSYLIVGTNPLCVELPSICGKDNPIFNQVPFQYIPRFDVPQTRDMVRKLGRIMGILFDDYLYARLTEDFGGHPFLIRHVCSVINRLCPDDRPLKVNKSVYEDGKRIFLRDYSSHLDMILNVLCEHYNDEYEMLTYLARGDNDTFLEVAELSPLYTNHLLGYGIIDESHGKYSFRIDAIKEHLANKGKYRRLNLSAQEMLQEISERRNSVEPRIRYICKSVLLSHYGKNAARQIVTDIMGEPRKSKNAALSFEDLFTSNYSGILFDDLRKVIVKQWECFKHVFGQDKDEFDHRMKAINKYRADAHAKSISKDDMEYFRVCMIALEKLADDYYP